MPYPFPGSRYARPAKGRCLAKRTKRHIDATVTRTIQELDSDATVAFLELLHQVHRCSGWKRSRSNKGVAQAQLDGLRNLALFHEHFLRPISSWSIPEGSIYAIVDSLAQHLLARHSVPHFLSSVWYGGNTSYELKKRRWFIQHAAGTRFRDLDLPLPMTRRMERFFLASADHLTLEHALRRAELLGLGASPRLADAYCASKLGRDFSHSEFWQTVALFFVRVSPELDLNDVGPVIDFIQTVRHATLETGETVAAGPAQPDFSIKGRTLRSILSLVQKWHWQLSLREGHQASWPHSQQQSMTFDPSGREDQGSPWEIVELTTGRQLQVEGRVLQHCVGSYVTDCANGTSRIWSLRRRRGTGEARSVVTVEVNPSTNTIVQARGLRNRSVTGMVLHRIQVWARREHLRIAL